MKSLLCCAALLPLTACATDRLFAPRENANGSGPTGRPAAVYVLADPARGEVRLWSEGARTESGAGAETTVLHLGFELENPGTTPLQLDVAALRVSGVMVDGGAGTDAVRRPGIDRLEAAPGGTARGDFEFEVPGNIAPRAITGFDVHWTARCGDQSYAQITPFQTFYPQYDDRCEPWPWWGFGFGWRWHRYP